MAKVTSKAPGKFAVKGGSKGGMQNFKAVGAQAPGVVEVAGSGGGKSFGAKLKAGPTGKIGKQGAVKPVKSGITSVS